jgi:hypothetical protein
MKDMKDRKNPRRPMPEQVKRVFTPLLVLGHPGAGKTSLIATFAEYLWEKWARVLLLYSWDGGAIPTNVQRLMKYGLIRFWRVRTRSAVGFGIESVYDAARGYWPTRINTETGETEPAVTLVGPVTQRYTISCPRTGEVLETIPTMDLQRPIHCGLCKTIHQKTEQLVKGEISQTPGYEQVGGVAYDSLTSMGNIILDHMDHARGAGQVGGEKSSFGGVVTSGNVKFGGTNRADIGFAQTRCREAVHNTISIPNLKESPVFTALSFEATDEGGLPVVGPKLPGRAATDEASAWFGNVCEMGRVLDEAGKEHHALFLRPFTDPQNRRHLLKTSASPAGVPDVLIDPLGQPWAQANLGGYFKMLADLMAAMAEDIPGAPGLAATPATYGEPFRATAAAQPVPSSPAGGNGQSQLPPLVQPTPPAVTEKAPAVPTTPPAGVVARRKRVEPPAPPTTPPTTPPTEPPPAAAAPLASPTPGGPPPPPGMKPPQRAPGS